METQDVIPVPVPFAGKKTRFMQFQNQIENSSLNRGGLTVNGGFP